ncbi:hypothetical protein ZOSMA_7G00460 [Zostera marina]|uniref:Kinesin motor domain-containing protein n=1 Tax=Zostera marina TaxID=29655 RepID=A0A0K9NN28_ZOSMR|nr:hypothetical protein ZOSMA_7G00460 [Zostera marina]
MSSSRASTRSKVPSSVSRPKAHSSSSKRSSAVISRSAMVGKNDSDCSRVRVAVRLRPRITTEKTEDIDSSYCVELQSEINMLKLRKNNWNSESYKFDEVLSENSSQKRVYEVVAKPVVEVNTLLIFSCKQ